jgi:hypothetical protein
MLSTGLHPSRDLPWAGGPSLCSRSNVDQVGLPQMALRFSHLPPGLRQLALGQHSPFMLVTHTDGPGTPFSSRLHCPHPVSDAGPSGSSRLLAGRLLFKPQPQSVLPQVLQDDAFIPCNRQAPRPQPIIYSPYEADQSLLSRFGAVSPEFHSGTPRHGRQIRIPLLSFLPCNFSLSHVIGR